MNNHKFNTESTTDYIDVLTVHFQNSTKYFVLFPERLITTSEFITESLTHI